MHTVSREVLQQQRHRETSIDFGLIENARFRSGKNPEQRSLATIRILQLASSWKVLLDHHCDTECFLTAGASIGPNAQRSLATFLFNQLWKDARSQGMKGCKSRKKLVSLVVIASTTF